MVGRKPGQGQLVAIAIRPAGVLVGGGGGVHTAFGKIENVLNFVIHFIQK